MTIKTYIELEIEVEFDGTPAERPTRDEPGCPAEIEITGVTILQNQSGLELTPQQAVQVETDVWTKLATREAGHD